ncbi:Zinc metalloproteinase nas-37 [Toxocara canis]|uniref:Zinc metalloproteinase nas-37 n=1 Tax=Toxocara canis TaxID=6265 RepID=A0A0B2VRK8_TOXCA|nr:Zinc metalloproteinase nas-37 [Toxocara canis]
MLRHRFDMSPGQVLLVVDRVDFACEETCYSYVELKSASEKTATGPRLCCSVPTASFLSEGSDFIVIFHTANNVNSQYQGFEIRYKAYGRTTYSTAVFSTTPTTMIITTSTDKYSGVWSEWAGWSGCTRSCGGCGIRRRVRGCYSRDRRCTGPATMEEACGLNPCPTPTNTFTCTGRLVLPCDLMDRLTFGERPSSTAIFNDPSLPQMNLEGRDQELRRIYESNRFDRFDQSILEQSEQLCEKYFMFSCSTSVVTINIDWKDPKRIVRDTRGCCDGYYINEGICKKIE